MITEAHGKHGSWEDTPVHSLKDDGFFHGDPGMMKKRIAQINLYHDPLGIFDPQKLFFWKLEEVACHMNVITTQIGKVVMTKPEDALVDEVRVHKNVVGGLSQNGKDLIVAEEHRRGIIRHLEDEIQDLLWEQWLHERKNLDGLVDGMKRTGPVTPLVGKKRASCGNTIHLFFLWKTKQKYHIRTTNL